MATNRDEIVVAQIIRVYLAVVGTVAPADASVALGVGWREVGLTTEDSLSFATDPSFAEVRSHQSAFPTRRFQTGDSGLASVDLQQWSGENFKAVFGGGTVTEISVGQYKFTPPAIGGRSSVAAIIEVVDGTKRFRYVIPRCFQVEGVTQEMPKASESTLPLRLAVEGSDVGDPWYMLTNDPAFEPAA